MLLLLACAPPAVLADDSAPTTDGHGAPVVLHGGTVVGLGRVDVTLRDGRIVKVGAAGPGRVVDVTGRWIVPAVIDSHVHLAYLPAEEEMLDGGVAGVVDLAAPSTWIAEDHGPLRVLAAGPMITADGGYPTRSWGRNGYGLEVSNAQEGKDAVGTLAAAGARVVKVPIDGGPALDAETLAAVVAEAHGRGERVAVHALGDSEAAQAASAGADVLAHTPVEPLASSTLGSWSKKAVISTLSAFGGAETTQANLRALRDAGATVLYGTDFGNTRTPGVDPQEIALLSAAGLTPAEILAATTSAPAAWWGFDDLGAIAEGKAASFLVLDRDPLRVPVVLARPAQVWIDGRCRQGCP